MFRLYEFYGYILGGYRKITSPLIKKNIYKLVIPS